MYNAIFDRIDYLISKKSGIADNINRNFARIRIDSFNSLPIKKALAFHNVIILIKSVANESKNNYYYNIFSEKGSYKEPNTQYFQINVCICFSRIDFSEGIDVNKTSESKECDICQYRYFLNKGSKFQPNVCNRCHDLLMMSMNLSNIAILNIKGSDFRCIMNRISKNETIN